MNQNMVNNELIYRGAYIDEGSKINEEERTVEITFSSETPVERSFGYEVLDHSAESVNLERLNAKGPLLLEHDTDRMIGVVESAWIDEEQRQGKAVVRFGRSQLATEIWDDVRSGLRNGISIGYSVARFVKERSKEDRDVYRSVDWSIAEVSCVACPADLQAKVARAYLEPTTTEPTTEEPIMEEPIQENHEQSEERVQEVKPEVRIEVRPDKRAAEIASLGERFEAPDEAVRYISEGKSLDEFKNYLMERNASQPIEAAQGEDEIGMSKNDVREYSLNRAIIGAAEGRLDGIELEASKEIEKRFGRPAQGFYVPNDILKRDLTATGGDTGDVLVSTVKPELIEARKATPVVVQLGARVLSGLSSNVTLPKAGASTAYWVAENGSPTEDTPSIGSITLSPKRVAAYTELSKQLLQQSTFDVENMVRSELLDSLAIAIDKAAIDGGGSNEPSGVLDASNIGSETGGHTFANYVEAEADVMTANALSGALAYVTTPALMATLKTTEKSSGTGQFIWQDNSINGYPAIATNHMTADISVFGAWDNVVIGQFGSGVDVVVDAFSLALSGMVRVTCSQMADIGIRHDEAFSKITA